MRSVVTQVCPKEVKQALFSIKDTKAPAPDIISAFMFQKGWEIVNESIVKFVKDAFTDKVVSPQVNGTTISLIPKVENPERVTHFIPM